ncbi:MAG: ACT domain-containing protein, partial [Chloroflexota bacterium]
GGYPYVEGETLIVEVEDKPGGLASVAEKLAAAGVDIRGVLFVGSGEGKVETAFSVDDVARARRALGID